MGQTTSAVNSDTSSNHKATYWVPDGQDFSKTKKPLPELFRRRTNYQSALLKRRSERLSEKVEESQERARWFRYSINNTFLKHRKGGVAWVPPTELSYPTQIPYHTLYTFRQFPRVKSCRNSATYRKRVGIRSKLNTNKENKYVLVDIDLPEDIHYPPVKVTVKFDFGYSGIKWTVNDLNLRLLTLMNSSDNFRVTCNNS